MAFRRFPAAGCDKREFDLRAALTVSSVAWKKTFLRFWGETQGKSSGFLKKGESEGLTQRVNPMVFDSLDENSSRD